MKEAKKVIVTHGEGPFNNAKKALAGLDLSHIKGKSVLIKPNIGRNVHVGKGINTHPEAIAGVIEVLQQNGASKIAIGESPILGVKTLTAFDNAGVTEVAEKYGCELLDMDAVKPLVKDVKDGRILTSTKICRQVYDYDILLSLPVTKCHMHTGVTLGIKNMKGCLYRREKVRYHQLEYLSGKEYPEKTLDSAISDLATILLPDITVVDGYIGMEGLGPSGGEPVNADFAVASLNPVGADVVACRLMGMDAVDIPHLRLIAERLDYDIDVSGYEVTPSDFEKYKTVFKKPENNMDVEYPDVALCDKESCSACLSTVMFFLKRFKDDMTPYLFEDGKLHLAIGKGVTEDDIEEGTILIGNCTQGVKEKGIFITGCPPVPTRIYKAITGDEPQKNEPDLE